MARKVGPALAAALMLLYPPRDVQIPLVLRYTPSPPLWWGRFFSHSD